MKTIGRTNDGGYIVEMNSKEHNVFARLAGIESGWTTYDTIALDYSTSFDVADLSNAFAAIRTYTHIRANVNQLRKDVESLDNALRLQEEEAA